MLKGEQHKVYRLIQGHNKPRHFRIGERQRLPLCDLIDPERHNGASGAKHISVTSAAYFGRFRRAALGDHDLFHHGLAGAHRIDRIGRLVRR